MGCCHVLNTPDLRPITKPDRITSAIPSDFIKKNVTIWYDGDERPCTSRMKLSGTGVEKPNAVSIAPNEVKTCLNKKKLHYTTQITPCTLR